MHKNDRYNSKNLAYLGFTKGFFVSTVKLRWFPNTVPTLTEE